MRHPWRGWVLFGWRVRDKVLADACRSVEVRGLIQTVVATQAARASTDTSSQARRLAINDGGEFRSDLVSAHLVSPSVFA